MIQISDKIPTKGYVLAYFKERLIFEPYTVQDGKPVFKGSELFESGTLQECHFFDKERDCFMIHRQSRNDMIVKIRTADEEKNIEPDLIFMQTVLIKDEYAERADIPSTLRIINRYEYSDSDTLVLKNYRISF